jgi:uncharacterized protein YkwD
MRRVPLLRSAIFALTSLLLVAATTQASTTSIKAGADQGIEQGMIALVNSYRAEHGLAPLTANNALMRAARSHSRDMVENNYFDHTSLDGEQFSRRLTRFGYRWQSAGEAIGEASGLSSPSAAADQAVTMWRQSPPHNRILLTPSYKAVGIGAWCTGDTGGGSTCSFTLDAARS